MQFIRTISPDYISSYRNVVEQIEEEKKIKNNENENAQMCVRTKKNGEERRSPSWLFCEPIVTDN